MLAATLSIGGYGYAQCGDGLEAIGRITAESYDLILLDVMLPGADGFAVLGNMKTFFEGMAKQFSVVVALIVAGQVFGKGLIAIGAVNSLITGVESLGMGVGFMVIVMSLVIGVVAFLMGSGNAPFFSFAALIPSIASKFGVHSADMLLPLQTMTGFGRTLSPVTGAIVAVAGIAGVSPFRLVKRNAVPLLLCILLNYILTFVVVL